MKLVEYNSQRDNFNFNGEFSSWSQCFTTSVWMLMCYFLGKSPDDAGLAQYLKTVDDAIGKLSAGAEEIVKRLQLGGHTSYYWVVQQAGIEDWMHANGEKGKAIYVDHGTWENFCKILDSTPVILATDKLANLPGGHIILATNLLEGNTIGCNDPFGNATSKYENVDGQNVHYPENFLKPATERVANGGIRYMYWEAE